MAIGDDDAKYYVCFTASHTDTLKLSGATFGGFEGVIKITQDRTNGKGYFSEYHGGLQYDYFSVKAGSSATLTAYPTTGNRFAGWYTTIGSGIDDGFPSPSNASILISTSPTITSDEIISSATEWEALSMENVKYYYFSIVAKYEAIPVVDHFLLYDEKTNLLISDNGASNKLICS